MVVWFVVAIFVTWNYFLKPTESFTQIDEANQVLELLKMKPSYLFYLQNLPNKGTNIGKLSNRSVYDMLTNKSDVSVDDIIKIYNQ